MYYVLHIMYKVYHVCILALGSKKYMRSQWYVILYYFS